MCNIRANLLIYAFQEQRILPYFKPIVPFLFVKGIPPRGQFDNPLRKKINHINSGVSASVSGIPNVFFFDVDPNVFINSSDGSISHLDMYDYLHLTRQGYRKLLEPLLDEIQTLLKNFLSADAMSASEAEI